ncbi:MAG: UDP-Glc:alpha-D-GlcNAc-diphosphoundecaprenol beta-1,3-glucosyltransferase WfgD [Alphaproteobacteria bacterium MarineAlpha11_Bin1]|nr:MAG: UDP-Glc:alpha-D-GlcNAc-diphosphoundecaprenol beta-1,3-glucosyltransferase WfgD [Alphaproteobacteria bacterium MarineAlpha11_Bin1]|tara:strand:+ start:6025 stop:6930 length:906 start_codon:yes stop_codon:yes gene_type:complete
MTSPPPDISVIVPAFRAEKTIRRALQSVAAQTASPREVIVIDDGSPDGTADEAEACRPILDGIELLIERHQNMGAGAARNRAIKLASSPYLAFLDADDEWMPEKLARSVDVLQTENYDLVAHDYLAVSPNGETSEVDCTSRFHEHSDPYVNLYRKGYLATSTILIRRDLVMAAGGFDTTLRNAQDFDLWLYILQDRTLTFKVFGEVLTKYYLTEGSITSNTEERIRCGIEIALRFAPDLSSRMYINLWIRTLAIYIEAMRAYLKRGKRMKSIIAVLRATPALVSVTFKLIRSTPTPRQTNL